METPVLLTHHARFVFPDSGHLFGAMSDLQAAKVRELVAGAGQTLDYLDLPGAAHALHNADAAQYAGIVKEWADKLAK